MGLGQVRLQAKGLLGLLPLCLPTFRRGIEPLPGHHPVDPGQERMGVGEFRIQGYGSLEESLGSPQIRLPVAWARVITAPLKKEVVSFQILRPDPAKLLPLPGRHGSPKGVGNGLGNLALDGQEVRHGQRAIVGSRPGMVVGPCIDELDVEPHGIYRPQQTPHQDIADRQLPRQHPRSPGGVPGQYDRLAGDHSQPTDLCQPGQDLVVDAVGEVRVLRSSAPVHPWKGRDRRPIVGHILSNLAIPPGF